MKVFEWRPESTFFSQPKTEWKLETMFKALERLGNPHLKLQPAERIIHIYDRLLTVYSFMNGVSGCIGI